MSHRLHAWVNSLSQEVVRPLRPLIFLILFHLVFSAVYISVFARMFGYGRRVMLLHLLLIFAFICLLLTSLAAIASILRTRTRLMRVALSLIVASSFMFLLLVYVANLVSNYYAGDNVSYEMAVNNVFHLDALFIAIGLRPTIAYLGLAVIYGGLLVSYFALSGHLVRALSHSLALCRRLQFFGTLKRSVGSVLVIIVLSLGYAGGVILLSRLVPGVGATRSEPILSLLTPTVPNSRAKLLPAEELARQQYNAPISFQRKNVILITVDSLRADHMSVYGYGRDTTPFLNGLLKQGHLRKVEFATANCPASRCGIMSILTSRYVENLRAGNLGLSDILYDRGYQVYLILSGDHSGFPDLKLSYGSNIHYYFDGANSRRFAPNDDHVLFEGLARVPAYHGAPSFFFFHLMSAHSLGVRFDGFDRFQPTMKEMDVHLFHKYDPVSVINEFDNRLLQTDDVLRQLFDALTQKGYLQNAVVVLLADHGQSLGEHGIFGHGRSLYGEGIRIPFVIYDPGEAQYTGLDFASQIDVAPTILERLGLPIPPVWQGRSIYSSAVTDSYHRLWKKPYCAAVTRRTDQKYFKYIYCEENQTQELYELVSDPKEQRNLITTADPALIDALRNRVVAHGVAVK